MRFHLLRKFVGSLLGGWLLLGASATAEITSLKDAAPILAHRDSQEFGAVRDYLLKKLKGADPKAFAHRSIIERRPDGGAWVGWIVADAGAKQVTVAAGPRKKWPMIRLDAEGHFALIRSFDKQGGAEYRYDVDGVRRGGGKNHRFSFEGYPWPTESLPQEGVPKGTLHEMGVLSSTKHYPGTEREWWVYTPHGFTGDSAPAKLMVINDGLWFTKGDGSVCVVLDNLIAAKKVPPVVAVFVNPGGRDGGRENRSNEYDTCTPRYAGFLADELLPLVEAKWPLSKKPSDRAILGSSSGGSCAFTAAWYRPDLFGNVVSFVGSFADFRPLSAYPDPETGTLPQNDEYGPRKVAHDYPGLIRKTVPRKPIRVFLQDGKNDLNNTLGHWYLNNLRMVAALDYAGYDFHWVDGVGFHSSKHGKVLLPEIFPWLWSTPSQGRD